MSVREYAVLIIIFLTNFLQGITGFAGTFLAMPPAIQLIGAEDARILLAVIAQISAAMILVTGYRHIDYRAFFKMFVFTGIGMIAGIFVFDAVDLHILVTLYGILVICIAVKNLISSRLKRKHGRFEIRAESPVMIILILAAGVLNGVFVSGGALLVVFAVKAIGNKEQIRATLALIWLCLDSFITVPAAVAGDFTSELLLMTGISTVLLFFATWAGTVVMKRISQKTFINITYILLLIAGITVFI